MIAETLLLLKASIPSTVTITHRLDPDTPCILGDQTQLHQVLMNLCANAYQAMKETGGELEIVAEPLMLGESARQNFPGLKPGLYARLRVRDTGCGIDPSLIERIFDPFFTTKPQGEGTGLGLSVVQGVVRSHWGGIHIESPLQTGTCIDILLPACKDNVVPNPHASTHEVLSKPSGHILFVDDEPMLALLGKQQLESIGYQVSVAASGIEALELFSANPDSFDLIFTDQTIPGMTGAELTRAVHTLRPKVPVLLYTGRSDTIDEARAHRIGVSAFLSKPQPFKTIARVVHELISRG